MELHQKEKDAVIQIHEREKEDQWRKTKCPDPSVLGNKTISNFKQLIEELHCAFETDNVNIEYINAILSCYKSDISDWKQFAKFDRYKYTRNLVDTGNGKYNLMLLCWGEGHGSGIHDHAKSHCFMKMLEGSLTEIRYAWPKAEDSKMQMISKSELNKDEVLYMHDQLGLHRVENPSNVERAVSLHLYCPPYNTCKVFNESTGHQLMSKVTFWSKYGKKNYDCLERDVPDDN